MRFWWLAVAVLMMSSVSGCFGGKDKKDDKDLDAAPAAAIPLPVLTLKVQVGNDSYDFSSAPAANATGNGTNATSNATKSSSSTSTAANGTGNSTGNSTGNATGNGTSNSTGNATNATLATPTVPTGLAPLNVTFTLGVTNIVNGTGPFNWTFAFGDEDVVAPAGNATNATGNATGNSTGNSTSSTTTSSAGNSTGNSTSNATKSNVTLQRGNGTTATFTHTYNATGNFTPSFRLTLANNTTIGLKANVVVAAGTVNVTADAPVQAAESFSGEATCLPTFVLDGGIAGGSHELVVLAGQRALTLALSYSEDVGIEDLDFTVTDPKGTATESAESGPEPPLVFLDPAEGTWTLEVIAYSCAGSLAYTIDATFGIV